MTFTVTMLAMGTARAPDRSCSGCHTGVNTGPAQDLEPMNATWRAVWIPRCPADPGEFIIDALAAHDVAPQDVVTLSRRGWLHFHSTHDHPHDTRGHFDPGSGAGSASPRAFAEAH